MTQQSTNPNTGKLLNLANPDLVSRMRKEAPINTPDMATRYVPGAKGYTDYPAMAA